MLIPRSDVSARSRGMEEILLVHVINGSPRCKRPGKDSHPPRELARGSLEEKRQYLEQATGVRVSPADTEAKAGDIAGAVVRSAYTENIPLIVMGGRGKGLLAGFILGSVSEGVIQRSNTDVLIVHLRDAKESQ